MESIKAYSDLIRLIPVSKQSTTIKKAVWEKRFSHDDKFLKEIFGKSEIVEISREDVFSEGDPKKKVVMVLMWGYPTGGRGKNINHILERIDELSSLLSKVEGENMTKDKASDTFAEFDQIRGLGISTWSKLLYFFDVSIDSRKCQIFDLKIVDSLNKQQFSELNKQEWKQDTKHYYQFLELVDSLATSMDALPEQVELFLFYYNLYYKFTMQPG